MCAEIYHCADFITSDPVQFPHRYTLKQDIEISGLLTAIMSFGNRKQILKKADELHRLMGDSPYQYVLSRQWEVDFPSGVTNSFYRMLSYADFYGYFRRLYAAYTQFAILVSKPMLCLRWLRRASTPSPVRADRRISE